VAARVAYGLMLQPGVKLMDIHATIAHEQIDETLAELMQVSEHLKVIVKMLEAAYVRVLAAACAHKVAGGEFKYNAA
jgi:hypothetical protein